MPTFYGLPSDGTVIPEQLETALAADVRAADSAIGGAVKSVADAAPAAALAPWRSDLLHRAFTPPAPEDTPTLTVLPVAESTLNATGNRVLFTRLDGTQATGVDIANDPSFLVEGAPTLDPYGTGTDYVRTPYLPGGATNQANYAATIETLTEAVNQEVEFLIMAPASTFGLRLYVDGAPLSLPTQPITGATAGNEYVLRLVFPTAKGRRIKLAAVGRPPIAGAIVPAGETLARPPLVGPRVAIIGDSYTGGSGTFPDGGNRIETGSYLAAHLIGAGSIWNFGIGGTGWVADGSAGAPFHTRLDEVLASEPDILIVAGSVNDGSNDYPELRTAVRDLLAAVGSVPEVYVTGPSLNPGFEGNNTAVREETIAAGYDYIDPLNPVVWLEPDMIRTDGVHPTNEGHMRTASLLAAGILRAREFAGFNVPAAVALPSTPVLFADDFNRADADTLGDAWTTTGGTVGIRSNMAGVLSTTGGNAYAVRDPGQANGVLKFTLGAVGAGGPFVIARYAATAQANSLVVRNNGGNWAVQNRAGGVGTYVFTSTTPVTAGDRVALTMDGTTITLTVNDVELWTGTITDNATQTLAGFAAWSAIMGFRLDDIAFEQLPAA